MSHRTFAPPAAWWFYSKKLALAVESPRSVGFFSQEEAEAKGMRLVCSRMGSLEEGSALALFWLVDPEDGVIADAKFQAFGPAVLLAAAEASCALVLRKNYDQARSMGADLIDRPLRDRPDQPAFPDEAASSLNLVLSAIECAAEQCLDIPLEPSQRATPIDRTLLPEKGEIYPGWETMSTGEKIATIEQVIASDIRPYIELDAGGIQIINLVEDKELLLAYQGSCVGCPSATGSTLSAIQQILRAKVHPDLFVTPILESFSV